MLLQSDVAISHSVIARSDSDVAISYHERDCFADARNDKTGGIASLTLAMTRGNEIAPALVFFAMTKNFSVILTLSINSDLSFHNHIQIDLSITPNITQMLILIFYLNSYRI